MRIKPGTEKVRQILSSTQGKWLTQKCGDLGARWVYH